MIPSTYDASDEWKEYIYCMCYCVVNTLCPGPNIYYYHVHVVALELLAWFRLKPVLEGKGYYE